MIAYTHAGSSTSIDNVSAKNAVFTPVFRFSPKIVVDSLLPDSADTLAQYISGLYAVNGYAIFENSEGGDILLSQTGVTRNFILVVTKRFVGIFYSSGLEKSVVLKSEDKVRMRRTFRSISPLEYRATKADIALGANCTSYTFVGDGVIQVYDPNLHPRNLPDFSYAFLNGLAVQALFGVKNTGLGVNVCPTNSKGAIVSLFSHHRDEIDSYQLADDEGVCVTSLASSDIDKIRKGELINAERWCKKYPLPPSDAYSVSLNLGLLCALDSTTDGVDTIVFLSADVIGASIQEWINGDEISLGGMFGIRSADSLSEICDEYVRKYNDLLDEAVSILTLSVNSAIQSFSQAQMQLARELNELWKQTVFEGVTCLCESLDLPRKIVQPIAPTYETFADEAFSALTPIGEYIECQDGRLSFAKSEYEKRVSGLIKGALDGMSKKILEKMAVFGDYSKLRSIDFEVTDFDNSKRYGYDHGCNDECYDYHPLVTPNAYKFTTFADFATNERWGLLPNGDFGQKWVDDSFKIESLRYSEVTISDSGLDATVTMRFQASIFELYHFDAEIKNIRSNSLSIVRRLVSNLFGESVVGLVGECDHPRLAKNTLHFHEMYGGCRQPRRPGLSTGVGHEGTLAELPVYVYECVFTVHNDFNSVLYPVKATLRKDLQDLLAGAQKEAAAAALAWLITNLEKYDLASMVIVGREGFSQDFTRFSDLAYLSSIRFESTSLGALKKAFQDVLDAKLNGATSKVFASESAEAVNLRILLAQIDLYEQNAAANKTPLWYRATPGVLIGSYDPKLLDWYVRFG